MSEIPSTAPVLSADDIEFFVANGFVRLDGAFPKVAAAEMRAVLWRAMGLDPDDPASWTQPVFRLGQFAGEPFVAAAHAPRINAALDQLVGPGRWRARGTLGAFPVRFPSIEDPGDAGWHIDVSFGDDPTDFLSWRANRVSRGRALLMLFLCSDVGPDDAPTRIR